MNLSEKVSPEKLKRVMAQINALIARADHPATPAPEAELSRIRAERMMFLYRIEEASLDADTKMAMGIRPTKAMWLVCPRGHTRLENEFNDQYAQMAAYVVHHVDGAAVRKIHYDETGQAWDAYTVYGFESDLAYGELLWNSMRIAFKSLLEPGMDPRLSDMENIFRMRNAGMERIRIADVMGYGTTGSATARVTNLFKKACAEHGVDAKEMTGKGNNVKTFRRSYAEAFTNEMWSRLYSLRNARGLNSHAMVLANRKDAVMELLYEDYPSMRPATPPPGGWKTVARKTRYRKPVERATNYAAADKGRQAARRVDLGSTGDNRLG